MILTSASWLLHQFLLYSNINHITLYSCVLVCS